MLRPGTSSVNAVTAGKPQVQPRWRGPSIPNAEALIVVGP